jgi:hypothetical protein
MLAISRRALSGRALVRPWPSPRRHRSGRVLTLGITRRQSRGYAGLDAPIRGNPGVRLRHPEATPFTREHASGQVGAGARMRGNPGVRLRHPAATPFTRIRKGAAISDPDESTRQASVREQSRSSDRAAQLCECCKRPASTGGCTCFSLIASAREAAPRSRTEDESERAMGACLGWGSDGR